MCTRQGGGSLESKMCVTPEYGCTHYLADCRNVLRLFRRENRIYRKEREESSDRNFEKGKFARVLKVKKIQSSAGNKDPPNEWQPNLKSNWHEILLLYHVLQK